MKKIVLKLLREQDGVTAIEYTLIAALIAVAIIVGANATGQNIGSLFNAVAACVANPYTGLACAL